MEFQKLHQVCIFTALAVSKLWIETRIILRPFMVGVSVLDTTCWGGLQLFYKDVSLALIFKELGAIHLISPWSPCPGCQGKHQHGQQPLQPCIGGSQ